MQMRFLSYTKVSANFYFFLRGSSVFSASQVRPDGVLLKEVHQASERVELVRLVSSSKLLVGDLQLLCGVACHLYHLSLPQTRASGRYRFARRNC